MFLIAYFLGNIYAKKSLQSNRVRKDYSKSKVGRFSRHSIYISALCAACDAAGNEETEHTRTRTKMTPITRVLFVFDIAIFVLKRDVKLQLTN